MPKKYEGYIVDTGARKVSGAGKGYIKFRNGVGILDLEAMAESRPDWVKGEDGEFVQFADAPISAYVDYWKDKGVKITECSESEAKAFRKAINSGKAPLNKFLSEPWEALKEEKSVTAPSPDPDPVPKKDEGEDAEEVPKKKIFSKDK